jgi:hypothetical protein
MTMKHGWDVERRGWVQGFRTGLRTISALLIGLGSAACGDVTAGGVAESEVTVAGDEAEWQAAGAPEGVPEGVPAGVPGDGLPAAIVGSPLEGTVTASLQVFLLTAAGDSVPISGETREVTVDVQGEIPASLGTYSVAPGSYVGVRVVFTGVQADVTAGLGDLPLLTGGLVTVDLGASGAIVVERESPIHLEDGDRLNVAVGLRAPVWIAGVAALPPPRVVPPTAFQGAVDVVFAVSAGG